MKQQEVKTKKCAYCGKEVPLDEIKDYFEGQPKYQHLVEKGLIGPEEQCPHCGYHNDDIGEASLDLIYSIL